MSRTWRKRAPLFLVSWLLRVAIVLVPAGWLLWTGAGAFLRQADGALKQAAPLVSAEASRALGRSVTVGRLTPGVSVESLWSMVRHPEAWGKLPIEADDIVVGTRVTRYVDPKTGPQVFDEPTLAASPVFARVRQVVAYVSLPTLLTGDFNGAVARVEIADPWVVLVRDRNDRFNVSQLVPPKKDGKPAAPFRTVIAVRGGQARFRDYHSQYALAAAPLAGIAPGPSQNDFSNIVGFVDLTGARDYRFALDIDPDRRTPTLARLAGGIRLTGDWGRGDVGSRPDSPSAQSARYLLDVHVGGANIPYWYYYFLRTGLAAPPAPRTADTFRVERGVADIDVSLAAPRPDVHGGPLPGVGIRIGAKFAGGDLASGFFPASVRNARGSFDYADGLVAFRGGASVLDAPIDVEGALWNITPDPITHAPARPEITMSVNAPRIPVARVLDTFLPRKTPLPPGVSVGGLVSASGVVSGPLQNPVATGRFAALNAAYAGYPAARNIGATVNYGGGVVTLTNIVATLDGGGRATGRAAIQVGGDKTRKGEAEFSASVQNVDLASLAALRRLTANVARPVTLAGRGEVAVVGRRSAGGDLHLAANVAAGGLSVSGIAFPVAQARVVVDQSVRGLTSVIVPSARIESAAGAVRVGGGLQPGGSLNLTWTASSLDLAALSRAFGVAGVGGLVSASGTVDGTVAKPRGVVREMVGLNLRLRVPDKATGTARQYALDTVRATNLVVTPSGVALHGPLTVRRFPAVAYVTGDVTDLLARTGPRLNLSAKIENVEFAEVERQLGAAAANVVQAVIKKNLPPQVAASTPANFSGSIRTASLTARGTFSDPHLDGTVQLGRLLVGPYPIDEGHADFSYNKARTQITNAALSASFGTLTANATLLADGRLSGSFAAPEINAEKFSFLTEKYASLGGYIALAGTVGGTIKAPVVSAQIAPSTLVIAGTPLKNFTVRDLHYVAQTGGGGRIELPLLSFEQGGTQIAIRDARYDLGTRRVAASLSASSGDIGVLLSTIRNSGLRDTDVGKDFVATLDTLPTPLAGEFSIPEFRLSGRLVQTKDGDGKPVTRFTDGDGTLHIAGSNLKVGAFEAPTLDARATLRGERVTLDGFSAKSLGSTIRASGTFDLNGDADLLVESNAVPLESLRTFTALSNLPLQGNIDLTVRVRGPKTARNVTATLQGENIDIVTAPTAQVAGSVAAKDAATPKFRLSLVRAEAQYRVEPTGEATLIIPEFLVTRGKTEITLEGTIPLATTGSDAAVAVRPINITAKAPRIDLAEFQSLLGVPVIDSKGKSGTAADLGGIVAANVSLTGTLRQPVLSGALSITGAHFALPRAPGDDRDKVNPIKSLDAALSLSGSTITFDKFALALGGPNKKAGDFGTLTMGGKVSLTSLERLQNLLKPGAATPTDLLPTANLPTQGLDGSLALNVKFDNFRPVEENLFGFGEATQGRVNGGLRITGPLLAPRIAATDPIHIADVALRLSPKVATPTATTSSFLISPSFDNIPIIVDGKAIVADQGTYRFEANGSAYINGKFAPNGAGGTGLDVSATLNTVGGYFQLPTFRFSVEKGGTITLRYGGVNSGVITNNVVAKTKIYAPAGTNISSYARSAQGGPIGSSLSSPLSTTTRYDVTMTLNGPLNILSTDGATTAPAQSATSLTNQQSELQITFTSDPALSKDQIIALLGTQQQADLARQGQVDAAFRSFASQALYSGLVPRYLAPITEGIQSTLGLSDLRIDYNPDGTSNIFVAKQLKDPFERFVLELQQTIQTRSSQLTSQQPYLLSLNYELFRLKPNSRIQPRMRVGVSQNEQRAVTYFLRGTIAY